MAATQLTLRQLATRDALAHHLNPQIFLRQINQESGWNPNARSGAGALGIAQFMPATARSYGINPLDPAQALDAAALYDQRELAAFHGDWRLALAAYNAGAGHANEWNNPNFSGGQTYNYVRSILGGSSPLAAASMAAAAAPAKGRAVPAAPAVSSQAAQQAAGQARALAALRSLLAASSVRLPTINPGFAPIVLPPPTVTPTPAFSSPLLTADYGGPLGPLGSL